MRHATISAEQTVCAQRDLQSAEAEMHHASQKVLEAYRQSDAERAEETRMDKWDQAEAVRYRRVMQRKLKASQRAWLSYRDAACGAVLAMYENGTMGPRMEASCREALTRERTTFLRDNFLQP